MMYVYIRKETSNCSHEIKAVFTLGCKKFCGICGGCRVGNVGLPAPVPGTQTYDGGTDYIS